MTPSPPPVPEGPRGNLWMDGAWLLYIAFNVFMMGWLVGGQYGERPARLKREADDWHCLAWQAVYSNAESRGALSVVDMESTRPVECARAKRELER